MKTEPMTAPNETMSETGTCPLCHLPWATHPRCPKCGYTGCDAKMHMDHHLCGEPTPECPSSSQQTPPAANASERETPRTDARQWSDATLARFDEMFRMSIAISDADNLKLVWLLNQAIRPYLNEKDVMGPEHEIWNEMENRLAPEYDGENYRITDTGWITPNGKINYI